MNKIFQEAARAKELRAKFEEWEASVGEDGGYTNLVDENGQPLETASKLKNRLQQDPLVLKQQLQGQTAIFKGLKITFRIKIFKTIPC